MEDIALLLMQYECIGSLALLELVATSACFGSPSDLNDFKSWSETVVCRTVVGIITRTAGG